MKTKLLFTLFFACSFTLFGQTPENIQEILDNKDHIGNTYELVNASTLVKHTNTENTQQDYSYSNKKLGKIKSFNIHNPLRIIINHNELSTLVITDNTLRETGRIFLPDLEIFSEHIAFAQAYDNTLWIFDDNNAQLIRVNEKGEIVSKTPTYIQDLDRAPVVTEMQANDNFIILKEKEDFIVCDQFGEYIRTIPIEFNNKWLLKDDQLYLDKNGSIEKLRLDLSNIPYLLEFN